MSRADAFEGHMYRFRQMAAILHPDRALGDPEVLQLMQRLEMVARLEPEMIAVQMPEGAAPPLA